MSFNLYFNSRLRHKSHKKNHLGYSLIELLVSLTLLAIMVTAAMPLTELVHRRNQERDLRVALHQIRSALDQYKVAANSGKIKKTTSSGYPQSLNSLLEEKNIDNPDMPPVRFLRKIPRDPFNLNMNLKPEDSWQLRSYLSSAEDPKPGEDVFDVYSTSNQIGINGIPYAKW
jgi:general secretion pathway protein G